MSLTSLIRGTLLVARRAGRPDAAVLLPSADKDNTSWRVRSRTGKNDSVRMRRVAGQVARLEVLVKRQLRKLVKDPKHWRARADEMRSVAAQVNDPRIKAATSGAADAYENLAQLCEVLAHAGNLRTRTEWGGASR